MPITKWNHVSEPNCQCVNPLTHPLVELADHSVYIRCTHLVFRTAKALMPHHAAVGADLVRAGGADLGAVWQSLTLEHDEC